MSCYVATGCGPIRGKRGSSRSTSLRWIIRNRAYPPWYLVRYWRFLVFKLCNRHITTRGLVFLEKDCEVYARPGYGRLILGRFGRIGSGVAIRAHEGTVTVGDKCVFGRQITVNSYLDVSIGYATILADWIYICDFDHVISDTSGPIKDQGIVNAPVHIGADCWLGTKVSVLRGTHIGPGCVLGAHAVVRGEIPAISTVAGIPGKVVKGRLPG